MWYISWFKHSSPSVSHSSSAWSQTNPFLPVSINRSSTGLGVWSLAWRMCSIAAGENHCSSLTQPNRLKMSLTLKSLICPPLGIHLNYRTITLGYPKIGPKNVKKNHNNNNKNILNWKHVFEIKANKNLYVRIGTFISGMFLFYSSSLIGLGWWDYREGKLLCCPFEDMSVLEQSLPCPLNSLASAIKSKFILIHKVFNSSIAF